MNSVIRPLLALCVICSLSGAENVKPEAVKEKQDVVTVTSDLIPEETGHHGHYSHGAKHGSHGHWAKDGGEKFIHHDFWYLK